MAHRAFEACYHAIPYFGAFEKQADTHATLLQRYTTMRKRLESMVVRKGRAFARWTELTKYLGAWKSFVRRSVQKRLMDQVTQVRTASRSPAGDATDSFIRNPSHQAQRGSSRRGSGASKGRDYRSMSTNDFVATFVGMARETHSLVLFRLLDEVGIGLWQSVVTHLLGDKLDEQGALKALGSVSSCRQAGAGATRSESPNSRCAFWTSCTGSVPPGRHHSERCGGAPDEGPGAFPKLCRCPVCSEVPVVGSLPLLTPRTTGGVLLQRVRRQSGKWYTKSSSSWRKGSRRSMGATLRHLSRRSPRRTRSRPCGRSACWDRLRRGHERKLWCDSHVHCCTSRNVAQVHP